MKRPTINVTREVVAGDQKTRREWRATCLLPPDLGPAPGVKGQATEDGPWIDATGRTPQRAVAALERLVGRAFLHVTAWDDKS